MYKFHEMLFPLMYFYVQKNINFWLRKMYYINPELWISKFFHESLRGILFFNRVKYDRNNY